MVISGQPQSAKNRRRIVKFGNKPALIKSKPALAYEKLFHAECTTLPDLLVGDLAIEIHAYYASRRPDLSPLDLIKDLLQGHAYKNDRQIKAECSYWNLDKENPRAEITLRCIDGDASTGVSSLTHKQIWGF